MSSGGTDHFISLMRWMASISVAYDGGIAVVAEEKGYCKGRRQTIAQFDHIHHAVDVYVTTLQQCVIGKSDITKASGKHSKPQHYHLHTRNWIHAAGKQTLINPIGAPTRLWSITI